MPPVTRIPKEAIIQTAYEIARKKGIEGINARAIAKKLNCSIQPIFHNFSNMEELKEELIEKIKETYQNYLTESWKDEHPYKAMGMNYIRFAKEEPKLFQIILMGRNKMSAEDFIIHDKNYEDIKTKVRHATGFSGEQLREFHLKIWIFTHGLATMLATQTCQFTEEQISTMLTDIFNALYREEKSKGEANHE